MIILAAITVTLGLAAAIIPAVVATVHQHHEGLRRAARKLAVTEHVKHVEQVGTDSPIEAGTPQLTAIA
jgi:hypothetical protein